ncbi:uncharacterized protein [Nicotiana sylvestris]|uniref:uncharacterized protein n=1 Tax=Nicotiana sylvestris TaxID=4096 RepID=UPI00388C78A2
MVSLQKACDVLKTQKRTGQKHLRTKNISHFAIFDWDFGAPFWGNFGGFLHNFDLGLRCPEMNSSKKVILEYQPNSVKIPELRLLDRRLGGFLQPTRRSKVVL